MQYQYSMVSDNLSNSVVLSVREDNLSEMFDHLLGRRCEMGIAVINDIEFPAVQSAAIAKNLSYEVLDISPLYVHIGAHYPCFEQCDRYYAGSYDDLRACDSDPGRTWKRGTDNETDEHGGRYGRHDEAVLSA